MSECYAHCLSDCHGRIEREHFIPQALQKMFGGVTVVGFAWQKGNVRTMQPSTYAAARVLCARHHDELDGLDETAIAYFRNLMLILGQKHLASGEVGRIDEIAMKIDGRRLERWFLKTICGAISSKMINPSPQIPQEWIRSLFARESWPDDWALHVAQGKRITHKEDAAFQIDFHWANQGSLNGIVVNAFASTTLFSIARPDNASPDLLRRPKKLKFLIHRPDGSDVLTGVPAGQPVHFELNWPV
jgi:hypothetical protein